MPRSWNDVALGLAIGILVMTAAGGLFTISQRSACYDAQVEASAWTSQNTEPIPAAMIPNCGAWESALKVLASSGVGSAFAVFGLTLLRIRYRDASPAA